MYRNAYAAKSNPGFHKPGLFTNVELLEQGVSRRIYSMGEGKITENMVVIPLFVGTTEDDHSNRGQNRANCHRAVWEALLHFLTLPRALQDDGGFDAYERDG